MKQALLIFLITCCSLLVIASFVTFYCFFLSPDPNYYKIYCTLLGLLKVSNGLTLLSVLLINIFTAESWQEKKADNKKAFSFLLASNVLLWILAIFVSVEPSARRMAWFFGYFVGTYITSAGIGLTINIVVIFSIRMVSKLLGRNRTSAQDQQ